MSPTLNFSNHLLIFAALYVGHGLVSSSLSLDRIGLPRSCGEIMQEIPVHRKDLLANAQPVLWELPRGTWYLPDIKLGGNRFLVLLWWSCFVFLLSCMHPSSLFSQAHNWQWERDAPVQSQPKRGRSSVVKKHCNVEQLLLWQVQKIKI